jgi:hypoxanthine phosphoribosyltransferase
MASKIIYSWSDFDKDIKTIHHNLLDDGWVPDYIVGVKRGGLIPAISLSHRFNKPLIMMSCQLRDSNDNEVRLYEVEDISKDKNILIVDDMCDSGITLSKIIHKFIANEFNIGNIKTCALFYNTSQSFIVDYTTRTIDRNIDQRWIVFPWEQT